MKRLYRSSLLWKILFPVVIIGTICSLSLNILLTPPLVTLLKDRSDQTIRHAINMAISICEERFSDLIDLRMEDNPEINTVFTKRSLEEIKNISKIFPSIRMMVLDQYGQVQVASDPIPDRVDTQLQNHFAASLEAEHIFSTTLWKTQVIAATSYFPFWRWQIVGYIPEAEYMAPILMAKKIVGFGTFGTLTLIFITVLLVFLRNVNEPLKEMILATDQIRLGNFVRLRARGNDEISKVATAFNDMVSSLDEDKKEIDRILKDLKESEEQYRLLAENSLTLIIMLRKGRFLYFNQMVHQHFQYTPQDLATKTIFELVHENHLQQLSERLHSLEGKKETVEHFESLFYTKNGQKIWLEILATATSFQGQDTILVHAIDISPRKQLQKEQENLRNQLSRVEKMEVVGTLAGGVAHDLNNILGGIIGFPDLLLLDMKPDNPQYESIMAIKQSGLKAAAIVEDLLTLTRRGVVVTDTVNLNTTINEYLSSPEFTTLKSHHPGVKFEVDLAEDLMNIKGSPIHLTKTLMNLISNAAEAITEQGTISLRTENTYVDTQIGVYDTVVEGEYITCTISDTGNGISSADINKIFEPFFSKKIMGRSGTGLGMSVVWGTVKDLNGYIEVDSKEKDGTTFALYFPVTREIVCEKPNKIEMGQFKGTGHSILIVDDVLEQQHLAKTMLEKLEYTVNSVSSGEEAVSYLKNNSVDLILLDMIMEPGMDGLDTYREIIKIHPKQKVIIASGFSETERVKTAQQLGAGAYIKKPFAFESIALAVQEELQEYQK